LHVRSRSARAGPPVAPCRADPSPRAPAEDLFDADLNLIGSSDNHVGEAEYADHAHLSREAARLEGRSPLTFLSEAELRCGCGHEHSTSYGPLLRHRPSLAPA
jgi:hypothetical protein